MPRLINMLLMLLLAVSSGLVSLTADASPTVDTELAQQLLATLQVAPDGTLVIEDTDTAQALLGDDWAAASEQLDALNAQIRSGDVAGFTSSAELQEYRLKDPFTCAPLELRDGAGAMGEPSSAPQAAPQANCYCKNDCCFSGLCCKSGWWIFCWRYESC